MGQKYLVTIESTAIRTFTIEHDGPLNMAMKGGALLEMIDKQHPTWRDSEPDESYEAVTRVSMWPRHEDCDAQVCALEILGEVFGKDARSVAINTTCFPLSCKQAALQASDIVAKAKIRLSYGVTVKEAIIMAIADADEAVIEEMNKAVAPGEDK